MIIKNEFDKGSVYVDSLSFYVIAVPTMISDLLMDSLKVAWCGE